METPLFKKLKAVDEWLDGDKGGPIVGRWFAVCGIIAVIALWALAIYYTQ